jgi:glycosyltransferase involved in cell wall biosynthesis
MPHLLVIIPDRLSDLIKKGEVQPRYYNPGEVFDRVTILSTTPDSPDQSALQYMVGKARLSVEFYADNLELTRKPVEFMQRYALRRWASGGVDIARRINPDLIRCHGADWNTYLASRIKRALAVPYVVSLHINPDVNPVRRISGAGLSRAQTRHNRFYDHLESEGLRHADLVMPVYRPILPYLARHGVKNVQVCYNVLNAHHLRRKTNYALSGPARVICVGRLLDEKDPSPIIRAVASLPNVELLIVGDGPKRPALEALTASLGVANRVKFSPAIANDELCHMLPEFDLFAVHTEYWELNKSVLEALLTGLPVIINRRHGEPVPELADGDLVRMVDNTAESYREALSELLSNDPLRRSLGERAYTHAQENWGPARTEAVYANIYRRYLARAAIDAA